MMQIRMCNTGEREGVLFGANDIFSQEKGVRAVFSDTDIQNIASLFFENTEDITAPTELIFEKGSEKMFFLRAENFKNANIPLSIYAEEDTKISLVLLVKNEKDSAATIDVQIHGKKNTDISMAIIHLNEGEAEFSITSHLDKEEARSNIFFTEIGGGKSKAKGEIQNISKASNTHGDIQTRCILSEKAKSSIRGIPTVELGAENCVSHLDQKTILLSSEARSISIPMLNIANNKVEASHKSSFVHLKEEDAFYLQSRGIEKEGIHELLLDGMLQETLATIPEEAIQKCISELAHSFLNKIS